MNTVSKLLCIAVLVSTGLAAPGCRGASADCESVGRRVETLTRAALEGEPDDERRKKKESLLPALGKELEKQCRNEKWSAAVRRCVINAESTGDLNKCDPDRESEAETEAKTDPETEPEPDSAADTEPDTETAPAGSP